MKASVVAVVCLLVLVASGFAEPYLVDPSADYVTTPSGQSGLEMVAGDSMYLAVWVDGRCGVARAFAARIALSGEVLDPAGIPLPYDGWYHGGVTAAFDGSNFLVVLDVDGRHHINDWDIYGLRLSQAGEVLDPEPFPIAAEWTREGGAAVGFNGQDYLVAWYESSSDIRARRVSTSGQLLDTVDLQLTVLEGDRWGTTVGSDGTDWFVAWSDWRGTSSDVCGARVRADGTLPDAPDGFPIHDTDLHEYYAALVYDGSNYLVACEFSSYTDDTADIVGVRVSPAGQVLDSTAIRIAVQSDREGEPRVAFDGTNCLVTWEDSRAEGRDVFCARVSPDGAVLDPGGFPVDTAPKSQHDITVAYAGDAYIVGWSQRDSTMGLSGLMHARVSPAAIVLDTIPIAIVASAGEQLEPAVHFTGEQYLAVWMQWSGDDWDICGQRLDRLGMPLDTTRFSIATGEGEKDDPAVGFDGTNYLVAWGDEQHDTSHYICAVRIDQAGVILDSTPFRVSPGWGYGVSVAFGDSVYVLGWRSGRVVYATRVTSDGTVLDSAGITVYASPDRIRRPDVAFDGRNFLLTWAATAEDEEDIYAARLSPAGVLIDSVPLVVCYAERGQLEPRVCWGDSVYMVVWQDGRHWHSEAYAARITPEGDVLDPDGLRVQPLAYEEYAFEPDVVFDGALFSVVWKHRESGGLADIHGASVTSQGNTIWSGHLAGGEMEETEPTVAPAVGADFLLLYSGWAGVEGRPYNSRRIWGLRCSPGGMSATPNGRLRWGGPTLVRSSIRLGGVGAAHLLDVTGRKVMALVPGDNDIRHVSPGVYFVRREEDNTTTKVVIQH